MLKKISWVLLYLAAFIPTGFSLYYFSEKNLLPALVASAISMSIYTLLIIKNLRFLSSVSFFTMLLVSLLIVSVSGKQPGGIFPNISEEKSYMLALSLLIFFLLINSVFWAKTKHGFKKLISLLCTALYVLMLATAGSGPPSYYQNFVYTRINILILLFFSIFLIFKKKKILGFLGILLSIGTLLLSASMFKEKVYTLDDQEQKKVVAFIEPIAKEMFDYYNKEDYDNFCKYCGFVLKNMLKANPINDKRELLGPYTYFDEVNIVIRKGGRYYVEYPVKFQKAKNLSYLTFVMENISSSDPSLYGFAISDKPEQYTQAGFEMEN
ncbi:MAG: hypothetical protein ABIH36_04015 [bacterium]